METKLRYKYNVIEKNGREGPWSGIFKTKEDRDNWYNKYGKEFEANGFVLVFKTIKVKSVKKCEVKF